MLNEAYSIKNVDSSSQSSSSLEPRLRRAPGAPGEPEDPVQDCGHDGAWPRHHHEGQTGQRRFPWQPGAQPEVLHPLQAVRGAAFQTGDNVMKSRTSIDPSTYAAV